ncbi:hypothetical protein C7974DRAFT_439482 [Boeremia exigua]|uniref:uncharacterized protein n=1 Tax=Boeremia exigua TaxID=749465 RepID=UPI001E8DD2EF|nr:uncharacterized protein C7974DRAFT_439482 [Boeremia exigua]KAH6644221.1 hypothetical protein C7974DRAFT_439482 [Boeremia exigua]
MAVLSKILNIPTEVGTATMYMMQSVGAHGSFGNKDNSSIDGRIGTPDMSASTATEFMGGTFSPTLGPADMFITSTGGGVTDNHMDHQHGSAPSDGDTVWYCSNCGDGPIGGWNNHCHTALRIDRASSACAQQERVVIEQPFIEVDSPPCGLFSTSATSTTRFGRASTLVLFFVVRSIQGCKPCMQPTATHGISNVNLAKSLHPQTRDLGGPCRPWNLNLPQSPQGGNPCANQQMGSADEPSLGHGGALTNYDHRGCRSGSPPATPLAAFLQSPSRACPVQTINNSTQHLPFAFY